VADKQANVDAGIAASALDRTVVFRLLHPLAEEHVLEQFLEKLFAQIELALRRFLGHMVGLVRQYQPRDQPRVTDRECQGSDAWI